MHLLHRDLRYALRSLRKSPTFVVTAVVLLSLGIGVNTAVFSVMNTVILRSLPVRDPTPLVQIHTEGGYPKGVIKTGLGGMSFSLHTFNTLRSSSTPFSEVIAFAPVGRDDISVRNKSDAGIAQVEMVSGNFFSALGIRLSMGHDFTLQDEEGHSKVAIISYGYWSRVLGRASSPLGESLFVNGVPFTVVGVTPPEFFGVDPESATDIWIPLQDSPQLSPWGVRLQDVGLYTTPNWWCLMLWGRLAPGVTEQQALVQTNTIFLQTAMAGLGTVDPKVALPRISLSPAAKGLDTLRQRFSKPLWVLLGIVALVLLIASGNLAMLSFARSTARERDIAVRMALGASRVQLLQQFLIESGLISLFGGVLGLIFAIWATPAFTAWAKLNTIVRIDANVLWFTGVVSIATSVLVGLFPAFRMSQARKQSATPPVPVLGCSLEQRRRFSYFRSQRL
jgi:predicted permease